MLKHLPSLELLENRLYPIMGNFVEQTDKHYRVRLRSKSQVINEIAKRHDGGGHPLASGANSYSLEENDEIYQEIKDLLTSKD